MTPLSSRHLVARLPGLVALLDALPASAHVKWFAPYIVGAKPQPVSATLADPYFWTGMVLVTTFFVLTRLVERHTLGDRLLAILDRVSDPLWNRLDDFLRATIAGFFVAIFAVGGIYLTPDLKTDTGVVEWVQLLIAAFVLIRATMPLAALGLVGLWVLALREYDLFHLFDYLALGLGVAGYLWLAALRPPTLWSYRFDALRWGVAISLMWSSLEKFAYPDWFYPLVIEKPYLTFGLPRDAFIPMAGVAEFTLGLGLLSTPLIRRLSAIALFVIFNAAVYPFGRIDLVGHALIMAAIVAIAVDHTRASPDLKPLGRSLAGVPVALAASLVVFAGTYWGAHDLIYDRTGPEAAQYRSTHSHDPAHPHPVDEAVRPPDPTSNGSHPADAGPVRP